MEKSIIKKRIKELFPALTQSELVEEIVEKGAFLKLPAKTQLMTAGSVIKAIPIVFKGSIKIVREVNSGRTVFLYYVNSGQSCALTLSSCLKREISSVEAWVETDAELLVLPVDVVYNFVHKYPSWNDFVISTYNNRFEELLKLVDDVSFYKIDDRLVKYLSGKCEQQNTKKLIISHKEIADDLATSREVISRLLKQLENKGAIELGRGKLTVLGFNAL